MPWPLIAAAAIGVIGGALANRASAKQASQQMAFQDELSRTAHQREVADLRAAGLNPVLSGTGGRGASTPPGAQAPQRNIAENAVSTALAVQRQKQELKNMREQRLLTASMSDMTEKLKLKHSVEADVYGQRLLQETMNTKVAAEAQRGHLDAASFWSSKPYAAKRRVDAAAETARILVPLTTPGHSAYGHRKRKR